MNIIDKAVDILKDEPIATQAGNFSLLVFAAGFGGCLPPYISAYHTKAVMSGALLLLSRGYGLTYFSLNDHTAYTREAYERFCSLGDAFPHSLGFNTSSQRINQWYETYEPTVVASMNLNELEELIIQLYRECFYLFAETVFCESLDKELILELYEKAGGEKKSFDEFFIFASKATFVSLAVRQNEFLISSAPASAKQYIFADYFSVPEIEAIDDMVVKAISAKGGESAIKQEIITAEKIAVENKKENNRYRLQLDAPLQFVFYFVQLCMLMRDSRKDPLQKLITLIVTTARCIFINVGLPIDDVVYAYQADFFSGHVLAPNYIDELKRRKEGVAILFSPAEIAFEYGNIESLTKVASDRLEKNHNGDIAGTTAYRGLVRGLVSIINTSQDFSKFQAGDILVTSMTRPEFLPLMKMASAVVTDEGGVTCHAAIVARELKIPCVIGTKNATRLLTTGEEIEVDANEGIIRRFSMRT